LGSFLNFKGKKREKNLSQTTPGKKMVKNSRRHMRGGGEKSLNSKRRQRGQKDTCKKEKEKGKKKFPHQKGENC